MQASQMLLKDSFMARLSYQPWLFKQNLPLAEYYCKSLNQHSSQTSTNLEINHTEGTFIKTSKKLPVRAPERKEKKSELF
jgi:hypothetical protein